MFLHIYIYIYIFIYSYRKCNIYADEYLTTSTDFHTGASTETTNTYVEPTNSPTVLTKNQPRTASVMTLFSAEESLHPSNDTENTTEDVDTDTHFKMSDTEKLQNKVHNIEPLGTFL